MFLSLSSELQINYEVKERDAHYQFFFESKLKIEFKLDDNHIKIRVAGDLVFNKHIRNALQLQLSKILNDNIGQSQNDITDQVYNVISDVLYEKFSLDNINDIPIEDTKDSADAVQNRDQSHTNDLIKRRIHYIVQFMLAHITNLSDESYASLGAELHKLGLIDDQIPRNQFRNNPVPQQYLNKLELQMLPSVLKRGLQSPVIIPRKWSYKNNFFNDNFEVISLLGSGTFGRVYHVRHKETEREYAVKKIYLSDTEKGDTKHNSMKTTMESLYRTQQSQTQLTDNVFDFINELNLLIHLKHPNIVQYYNAWIEVQKVIEHINEQMYQITSEDVTKSMLGTPNDSDYEEDSYISNDKTPPESLDSTLSWSSIKTSGQTSDFYEFNTSVTSTKNNEGSFHTYLTQGYNDELISKQLKNTTAAKIKLVPLCNVVHIQMELCEKKSLFDVLYKPDSNDNTLTDQMRARITVQLIEGLWYLHENDVIHYDIKPENVFISGSKYGAKYGDFGVSLKGASLTGQRRGTLEYMAPELDHASVSPAQKADVYSLGIVLYELWTATGPEATPHRKHFIDLIRLAASIKENSNQYDMSPEDIKQELLAQEKSSEDIPNEILDEFCQHLTQLHKQHYEIYDIIMRMLVSDHQVRPFIDEIKMTPYIFKQLQKLSVVKDIQTQIQQCPEKRKNMIQYMIKQRLDELENNFDDQNRKTLQSNLLDNTQQDFITYIVTSLINECKLQKNDDYLEQYLTFSSYEQLRNTTTLRSLMPKLEQFIFLHKNKSEIYLSYADNLLIYYLYKILDQDMLFLNYYETKQIQIILKHKEEFLKNIVLDSIEQFICVLNTIYKIKKQQIGPKKYISCHLTIKEGSSYSIQFNNIPFVIKYVKEDDALQDIWDGLSCFQFCFSMMAAKEIVLCHGGAWNQYIQITVPLDSFIIDDKNKKEHEQTP